VQTKDANQDMPLTKTNFFGAAYARQLWNKIICVTPYSSKSAV